MWGFLTQARDYKRVNAFVETFSEKKTTVRLIFTEGDNEAAVTDPAVYQNAFNKIGDAVFCTKTRGKCPFSNIFG